MNLADSMRSQDKFNKIVFTGKRNIKYDGENIIYCLWIEWQRLLFADNNKLLEKNGSMYVPITSHKQKNTSVKSIYIYLHGTWKDNKMSVILDWRQRSVGLSSEGERPAGYSSRPVISPVCVLWPSQKGSPPHKKDMCELSKTVFLLHIIVAVGE